MKVKVKPVVFNALIDQYRIPKHILAQKINRSEATLDQWASTESEISIGTLKSIAKYWGCHWSIFLTAAPPPDIKKPKSHRRARYSDSNLSPETILAYQNASRILALSAEIGGRKIDRKVFKPSDRLAVRDPEELASHFRNAIGIDPKNIGDKVNSFTYWREKVESVGIYVSMQEMPTQEIKAFVQFDQERAVAVVNRNEKYESAKIFSLLHEVGHIFSGSSASCDLHGASEITVSNDRAEVFCNRFAGAVLLPADLIRADNVINLPHASFDDDSIRNFAKKYKVSFSVALRRLAIFDYITDAEYERRLKKFDKEELAERGRAPKKEFIPGPAFHPNRWVTSNSPAYANEVFRSYSNREISYGEVSKYLRVALEHVPKIQSYLGYD